MAELNQRSYVPKKEARQWVEAEQILPLLDGLDEVAAPFREACVEAINQFRREHGLLPIVVCSRIADYEALGTKLRLRTAVEVQPLAKRQIKDYLARVGEPLQGLRTALEADASLWELLETPLMLWVAMLAYRDVPLASLQGNTLEQRQRHLFAHFVEAMLRRRAGLTTYTAEQIKHWLSRLASALARNNQTVFYLENLDFQWLHTHTPRWLARVGIILATGLLANLLGDLLLGLIFGLNFLFGGLLYGRSKLVFFGLPLGFVVGIVSIVIKVKPVEKMVFHWTDLSSRRSTAIRSGLSAGLLIGLLYGLNFGLLTGLSGGLGVGLLVGLVRLFTSEATAETRSIPNQGTHRSLKVALISGVIFGPISASIFELIHVLAYGSLAGQVDVVSGGLGIGLLVGLFCGGAFSIKHFALRFSLWLSRAAPLRYVAFLAHAKDLLFLRQVGGGYIFTHRLLQEYFASLSQASCEFSIRLNASLEQVTPEVQTQILSNLRKVSGDSNLQIDSIYPGSVLIRLKGTVEGYRIIAELVRSGNLTDVLGMPIEEVSLITANAGPNLINDGEIQGGCEVFVSYSHKGRRFRDQLCSHMKVLERQGLVKIWHDRKIVAGTQWMEEIDERLNKASIILLLISPDFLASDYCYGVEVEKAIARHKEGQARVIPIILRQADWQTTLLGGLQALPSNGKPISQWADRDRAFHQICQELRVVISQLASSIPPR